MRLWLDRLWCGLRGHNEILAFDGRRLSVKCLSCGLESPGWTV